MPVANDFGRSRNVLHWSALHSPVGACHHIALVLIKGDHPGHWHTHTRLPARRLKVHQPLAAEPACERGLVFQHQANGAFLIFFRKPNHALCTQTAFGAVIQAVEPQRHLTRAVDQDSGLHGPADGTPTFVALQGQPGFLLRVRTASHVEGRTTIAQIVEHLRNRQSVLNIDGDSSPGLSIDFIRHHPRAIGRNLNIA
ncbi:hypothetical protein D3C72_1785880 [compost metagenome]